MYIIRLDDASEYRDLDKWNRVEALLDQYHIKPVVGVIPDNKDPELLEKYPFDFTFWDKVLGWQKKGWSVAMHGYQHRFISKNSGINPVNHYSEFAGLPLDRQIQMIKKSMEIFGNHGVVPQLFFAPAHTFDLNTLEALKRGSRIRVISDTVANNIYFENDFYFVPQQAGRVRALPMKLVTFCYHPNNMNQSEFARLEKFIQSHRNKFGDFRAIQLKKRKRNLYDRLLFKSYFMFRKLRTLR